MSSDAEKRLIGDQMASRLYSQLDLLMIIAFFAAVMWVTQGYAELARLFPNVIFGLGVLFAIVELSASMLPKPYKRLYHQIFSGLTDDFDIETELEEDVEYEPDHDSPITETERRERFVVISALLFGFYIVSYLIGFLLTVPLFVVIGLYLMEYRNVRVMILMSVFLMIVVYLLFGELMNVPITEGYLLDF